MGPRIRNIGDHYRATEFRIFGIILGPQRSEFQDPNRVLYMALRRIFCKYRKKKITIVSLYVSDSYPAFFLLIATTSNKKILKVQKL